MDVCMNKVSDAGMKATVAGATIALMLGILGPPEAWGQETSGEGSQTNNQPPPVEESPWSFRISPYLWMAGLSGDVGVNSRLPLPVINVDVDFKDIFENIDWTPPPIMLAGEVRYDRFGLVSDLIFLGLESGGARSRGPVSVAAEVDLDVVVWSFAGAFRVIQDGPATLDLLAGGRLWNADATGTLTGPLATRQRSGSQTWVDPIVGVLGRLELGGGFALQVEGDVGGFGVSSDLDWQVMGMIQYALEDWIALEAGYRHLAVDFEDDGFVFDAALSGPLIGASLRF